MLRSLSALFACSLLFAASVLPTSAQEPVPFGQVVTTLPVRATNLLTDHVRQWVYAATSDSTVTIIDTTTLAVVAVIPLDIQPGPMSLSENGALLYVASRDSRTITVLDMNLVRVVDTFTLTNVFGGATGLVAGRANRLYLTTAGAGSGLYQIDGSTGKIQATIESTFWSDRSSRYLAISPDRGTLYASNYFFPYPGGSYPPQVYDVTGPAAQRLNQYASGFFASSSRIVTDHSGRYVLLSNLRDDFAGASHNAVLVSGTDFSQRLSALDRGTIDGPLAFSLDDSVVFQVYNVNASGTGYPYPPTPPYMQVEMWRTADGTRLGETALTYPDQGTHTLSSLTVDASGAYLLVAQQNDSDPASPAGVVSVLGTGFAPVQPSAPSPIPAKPKVSVATLVDSTAVGQPPGKWQLSRTGKDLSVPLTVTYTLIGTAQNGYDYKRRTGISTFPAGSRHVNVTIVPKGSLDGQPSKVVNLILHPSDEYRRGDPFKGRITIQAPAGK